MSANKSILVLGAGELGMALVKSLVAHPSALRTSISILLRPLPSNTVTGEKVDQRSTIRSLGVQIVEGDLVNSSTSTLAAVIRPYHTIISCTGFISGPGTQIKLANAVLSAGVARYFPWQFGVDYDVIGRGSAQDLFDEQLDVRDLLRGQEGTEWVIVSTGMFMSFVFEDWFGVVDVKARKVTALGGWENRVTLTTVEDIGRLTSEIVFLEGIKNEVVYLSGATVTYKALADTVEIVLNERIQREVWDVERLERELAEDPGDSLRKYRVVFAKGKGVAWDMDKTFNAKKRIQVTNVERWARKNLKKTA